MTTKDNLKKYSVAALKGLVELYVPFGSLAVELFNVTIPEQRLERVEKLVKLLASKEFKMTSEELEEKFHSPEFVDIFEDVIHQAARALSNERLEYLASVLEKSLTEEQMRHLKTKRLLSMLEEINDVEIIILKYFDWHSCICFGYSPPQYFMDEYNPFEEKHNKTIEYLNGNTRGYCDPPPNEYDIEQYALHENYKNNLINLGLIGYRTHSSSSNPRITKLGDMLLKVIGFENKFKRDFGEPVNPFKISEEVSEEVMLKGNKELLEDLTRSLENTM